MIILDRIAMALVATLGTWFITALGAATVIFFKGTNQKAMNLMLGFEETAGLNLE